MKKISLIGATGSIGRQTLDVISAHPDKLRVVALAAGTRQLEDLSRYILEFSPDLVSVPNDASAKELKTLLPAGHKIDILVGEEGLLAVATHPQADIVLTAVVGFLGVKPTAAAIKQGKTIALANKETLVAAGSVIMPMAKEYGAKIVPVDSEHSAIHQCLHGYQSSDVRSLWLTGSGGPFRTWEKSRIERATIDDALNHPNWSMGKKITIDSATLMNKGLEFIETKWLFNIDPSKIKVVIHPQSVLHSAVEFKDGSIVGQFGLPDMRLPIHYALFYPVRTEFTNGPRLDLRKLSQLTFEEPDFERFPCLRIAQAVAQENNTLASALNAANEILVEAFLKSRIGFWDISVKLERILDKHKAISKPDLDDILDADQWARREAESFLRAIT